MENFDVKVFMATDSFLYLPAYIAKDLEILHNVLGPEKVIGGKAYKINITFVEPPLVVGDTDAIKEMLNNCTDTSVAIAIGSPVAFLKPTMEKEKSEKVKVVGAIINKLTFWAISNQKGTYSDTTQFKNIFTKIIYPNDKFITGNYFGKIVRDDIGIDVDGTDSLIPVDFDNEIKELRQRIKCGTSTCVAITADMAAIAEATIAKGSDQLYINHYFSQRKGFEEFLTTGIITSKESCEKFPEIIVDIIVAIQKSIAILYSSKKTARKICADIARTKFPNKFHENIEEDSDVINEIVRRMYSEKIYPHDLNIERDGWDNALKVLASTYIQQVDNMNSFDKFVDNTFVHKAEKSIAGQFGIDLKTFDVEIKPLKDEIEKLNKTVEELKTKAENRWLFECCKSCFCFIKKSKNLTLVITILALIGIPIANIYSNFLSKEGLIATELAVFLGGPSVHWIISLFKKKNDETND